MLHAKKRIVVLPRIFNGDTFHCDRIYSVPRHVTEHKKHIGGVGATYRWTIRTVAHDDTDPIVLFLYNVDDVPKFHAQLAALDSSVVSNECEMHHDEEYGNCTMLRVHRACDGVAVAVALSRATRFEYAFDDPSGEREQCIDVGIERFDRSDWNFWNQTEETAAPKQSWHKWDFSWAPHFRVLPFTWQRLAANVSVDTPLSKLPKPLRFHVAQHRKAFLESQAAASCNAAYAAQLDAEIRRCERTLPKVHHVTASITREQARELLSATFFRRFCYLDDSYAVLQELSAGILDAYLWHGYTSRLIGPYRQEGNFVGHGAAIRRFKQLRQYNIENLPLRVLNRVYRTEGDVRGRGGDNTRKRRVPCNRRVMHNDVKYAEDIRLAHHRRRLEREPRSSDDL